MDIYVLYIQFVCAIFRAFVCQQCVDNSYFLTNVSFHLGALEIENVAATDDGEYYCQATSLDKTKVSQQATLQVKEAFALRDPQPPVFIARPKSMVGKVGDNITLDCATNGYPEPTVVWLKDGATIDMA